MNLRKTLLALGLGFAAGFVVKQQLDQFQSISPEEALERAKDKFRQLGPINGSWIYMKPEQIEKNGLVYDVYRGGVTRNIDGENIQFDFYADVDTGTVVDTKKANI